MTAGVERVRAAVRATAITAPTGFTWFGRPLTLLGDSVRNSLDSAAASHWLEQAVADHLYTSFYCTGGPVPVDFRAVVGAPRRDPGAPDLSAANVGRGRLDSGWLVLGANGAAVRVHKHGLTVTISPEEFRPRDGGALSPGADGGVWMPKEFPHLSPGFYLAAGNLDHDGGSPISRVYWNVSRPGAVILTRLVTTALNERRVPFRFKTLTEVDAGRCDAAVLYVRTADWDLVRPLLPWLRAALDGHLLPVTPTFTKQLAPGIGVAEEPEGGMSFGIHRCGLIAKGIVAAHEQGLHSLEDRVTVVADRLAAGGVDLARPHLNAGSPDRYEPLHESRRPSVRARLAGVGALEFQEVAHTIAGHIARVAIMHGGRCTWMSPFPDERRRVQRTIGPDLYSGTAGIGLFLAEASAASADESLRRVSRQALRQALATIERIDPDQRLGLFAGWSGVAWACAEGGRLLDDGELDAGARELTRRIVRAPLGGRADLISGQAGAIVACLALAELLRLPAAADFAVRLGDDLLASAQRHERFWTWRTINPARERNLTGLSHGASGIAWALAELHSATGEARFADAMAMALAYERTTFDPDLGNWPDLRGIRAHRGERRYEPLPHVTFWCHGAGGILLARIRAREVVPTLGPWEAEARAGITAVRQWLTSALASSHANFSLCHGLAGNALVLRMATATDDEPDDLALVDRVARWGTQRYAHDPSSWPCAAGGGPSPGLMLGLAGIGHCYLQLAGCGGPELLLLRPSAITVRGTHARHRDPVRDPSPDHHQARRRG